jgi:hypothetical protein
MGSTLSRYGNFSVTTDVERFNIIVVVVHIILHVCFFSVNFTSSEELLGVAGDVLDDTNSSSEVSSLTITVEVSVLATVLGSVTIGVLKFEVDVWLFGVKREMR